MAQIGEPAPNLAPPLQSIYATLIIIPYEPKKSEAILYG